MDNITMVGGTLLSRILRLHAEAARQECRAYPPFVHYLLLLSVTIEPVANISPSFLLKSAAAGPDR